MEVTKTIFFLIFSLVLLKISSYAEGVYNYGYASKSEEFGSVTLNDEGGFFASASNSYYDSTNYNAFVIKANGLGVKQWEQMWRCVGAKLIIYSVTKASDGACIVAGARHENCVSTANLVGYVARLYAVDGNMEWEREITADTISKIITLSDGKYLVAGHVAGLRSYIGLLYSGGTVQYSYADTTLETDNVLKHAIKLSDGTYAAVGYGTRNPEGLNCLLFFFDANLNYVSHYYFGTMSTEYCYGIIELPDTNVVIVGKSNSFRTTNYDAYALKVTRTGILSWVNPCHYGISGDNFYSTAKLLSDGTFILVGSQKRSTIDALISHVDSNAGIIESSEFACSTSSNDQINDAIVIQNHLIAMGGMIASNANNLEICVKSVSCPALYGVDSSTFECVKCQPGTYYNSATKTCNPCSGGKYTNKPGLTVCANCGKGTYQDQVGQASCKQCNPGSYQNMFTKTSCNPCAIGNYQDQSGQEQCKLCNSGTYQDQQGKTFCISCLPGNYQNDQGKTSCKPCDPGSYQDLEGQSECKLCSAGFYQDEAGKASCKACSAGNYQNGQGKTSCIQCDFGTYAEDAGSAKCKPCKAGTYSSELRMSKCNSCPLGTYTNSEGSAECVKCPAGKYNSEYGLTECSDCLRGSYNPNEGSSSCFQCQKGTYSKSYGTKTCVSCLEGSYADTEGSYACSLCKQGTFTNITGSEICTECPSGFYADKVGNTKCNVCPKGTYTNISGSWNCTKCPINTYNNKNGSILLDDCIACPQSQYSYEGCERCYTCEKIDDNEQIKAYFIMPEVDNFTISSSVTCYLSRCPEGYLAIDIFCYPCNKTCKECSQPYNDSFCTECWDDNHDVENGKCVRINKEWVIPMVIALSIGGALGLAYGAYVVIAKYFLVQNNATAVVPDSSQVSPRNNVTVDLGESNSKSKQTKRIKIASISQFRVNQ